MAAFLGCLRPARERSGAAVPSDPGDFTSGYREGSEIVYVELLRHTNQPLGLILEGGVDQNLPVQVSALRPGGVAEQSGALQVGDRILSINGTATDHLTQAEVFALLQNAGNVVNLEIGFDGVPGAPLDDMMELKTAFITLPRDEANSFGFVISGGRLENRPITVSHIKQGSYAYRRGILRAGDRILQINGHDVRNATQTDAVQLLKNCEENCGLQIEYDVTVHEHLERTNGPLIVELQKPHGASLGISLKGSPTPREPIWISKVREAGNADRSGALHVGDRLLSVNGQNLENRTVEDARRLLAHSDINVTLEITPAHNFIDQPGFSPMDESMSDSSSRISQLTPLVGFPGQRRPSQASLVSSSATSTTNILSHPEVMTITLRSDPIGYGFGLWGGLTEYGNQPVVISDIKPGSPAGLCGQLQNGDRVLSINGMSLDGATLQQAVKFVQEADEQLTMEVEFDVADTVIPTFGTFEVKLVKTGSLNLGISLNGGSTLDGSSRRGDVVWIAGLKQGGIAYRIGSLQPGDVLLAIDGQSLEGASPRDAADMLSRAFRDVITLTVRKDSPNSFISKPPHSHKASPIIFSVVLNKEGSNLGISLSGSETLPGQPIVISAIRDGGVAHKTGALKVGDRILAINNESMFEKTLPSAVRILQSSGDQVTLKISKGVIRRRRFKPPSPTGRHRSQYSRGSRQYRLYRHNSYGQRMGSRISHTSDSDVVSTTSLEQSMSSLAHVGLSQNGWVTPQGRGSISNSFLATDPVVPNGKTRSSPTNRGRLSPGKERGSPNRDRANSARTGSYAISAHNRGSMTETTDEETCDDTSMRPSWMLGGRYGSSLGHYPNGASEPGKEWTHTFPRNLGKIHRNGNSLGRDRKKGEVPKLNGGVKKLEENGIREPVDSFEDAMVNQFTNTLLQSKKFVDKLNELAQPGSSDPDSDSDPGQHQKKQYKLDPHVREKVKDHVKSIMAPAHMEMITVRLVKTGGETQFGFTVSDGLLEPGIYISQLRPGGPAELSGNLKPYDRIMQINDVVVKDSDCCAAVPLLEKAREEVTLLIARNPYANDEATQSKTDH